MQSESPPTAIHPDAETDLAPAPRRPRVWPGAVIVASYWLLSFVPGWIDPRIFVGFLSSVVLAALLALLFWIWWFSNRTIAWGDRLFIFCANLLGGFVAGLVCDKSLGPIGLLLFGVPAVLTAWAGWLLLARNTPPALRRWGLAGLLWMVWGSLVLLRIDGVDGNAHAAVSWRWTPTAEDLFLVERGKAQPGHAGDDRAAPAALSIPNAIEPTDRSGLELAPGDWPGFRGPERDGVLHGVKLVTDWNEQPPPLVWRQRVGPGWSSFAVVGDRLFTQEQRGESECVVCFDATTGAELWSHADEARFSDGQAGAGPRATPQFAEGRVYAFGATGIVNCLDALTGAKVWTRTVTADCDAKLPMWGFSSSPLVAASMVVVYAGGEHDRALLAYRAATGEIAWRAATGEISYSSAQLVSIDGQSQILFLSDRGLTAVLPESGEVLWTLDAARPNIWRAVQPVVCGEGRVLIGSEDLGLVLTDVSRVENAWSAKELWASPSMQPAYNDFVVHEGYAYGFDGAIFACIDLKTGARRWKGGRYGHGQVLLLADQPLLLVLSETGEAVLLSPNPERHEELGRFQAITGKTWNHPVIARGRLFVRNGEEMACYAPSTIE
jgi:outer membrane protein assembly factor BamB